MHSKSADHPDEETLEKYLLGSLHQSQSQQIEEHLLVCQSCVETAGRLENYIRSMQSAMGSKKKARAARKGKAG